MSARLMTTKNLYIKRTVSKLSVDYSPNKASECKSGVNFLFGKLIRPMKGQWPLIDGYR